MPGLQTAYSIYSKYPGTYYRTVDIANTVVPDEDVDVANERRRVLRGAPCGDQLCITNLTKEYSTRKLGNLLAVDRLCVGVPQGEVSKVFCVFLGNYIQFVFDAVMFNWCGNMTH